MPPRNKVKQGVVSTITMEHAQIIFRNFKGKGNEYNQEGTRNFCVKLEPEFAAQLAKDGWNVKQRQPRDPEDDVLFYLPVEVKFTSFPPRITIIQDGASQTVDEEDVHTLDYAEIKNVDLIIRPYAWGVGSKTGIKAYLKTMFVEIEMDALTRKYRNVPVYDPDASDQPPWED